MKRSIVFALSSVLVLTSCGAFLPTPAYRETVLINPSISNEELTEKLLTIFAENGISQCRSVPHRDESLPTCSIP